MGVAMSSTSNIDVEKQSQSSAEKTYKEKKTEDHLYIAATQKNWVEFKNYLNYIAAPLSANGDTALHMAVTNPKGLETLINYLTEENINITVDKLRNKGGNTPLHAAASIGTAEAAALLLRKWPGMMGERTDGDETAIFRAARYGKTKVLKFLVDKLREEHKVDNDYRETLKMHCYKKGVTILHAAVRGEHIGLSLNILFVIVIVIIIYDNFIVIT